MATDYIYIMSIWFKLELIKGNVDWFDKLREHIEREYQLVKAEIITDPASEGDSEQAVLMQFQLRFQESEMENAQPTPEAIDRLVDDLEIHLEKQFRLTYLEVLDDAPASYLLDARENADE